MRCPPRACGWWSAPRPIRSASGTSRCPARAGGRSRGRLDRACPAWSWTPWSASCVTAPIPPVSWLLPRRRRRARGCAGRFPSGWMTMPRSPRWSIPSTRWPSRSCVAMSGRRRPTCDSSLARNRTVLSASCLSATPRAVPAAGRQRCGPPSNTSGSRASCATFCCALSNVGTARTICERRARNSAGRCGVRPAISCANTSKRWSSPGCIPTRPRSWSSRCCCARN